MSGPRRFRAPSWLRRAVVLSVVTAVTVAGSASTAAAASAPSIGHAGRWITDASGRVLILHGLNMVYKVPPYYPAAAGFGADDAAVLERTGFNVVRVGVIWKAVEPKPGVYNDHYLAQIAGTARTLAKHGILSLLDFHQDLYNERFQGEGAPDWAVQDDGLSNPRNGFPINYATNPALQRALDHFWSNSPGPGGVGLQDRYAAAWRHVARRFRSLPGVLGYELLNEPSAGAQFVSCLVSNGCPAFDAQLTAFNRRVAKAIRTADRQTLIFYEPDVGFDFGVDTHIGPLRRGPAGFSFHDYCLAASPNGCPSEPQGFANALRYVRRSPDALILTEFGSNPFRADLGGMVSMADRNMVPWIEWSFCPCHDPTGATPDPLVIDPARPPSGSNLGSLAMSMLVEPFPQVIAGTPRDWAYDRETKTFQLRYSTARTDRRGRFRAGAITEIAAPRLIYGRRYAVHVQGGAIVSSQGARILEIAACSGARRVSVKLLPSGRDRESCRP